MVDFKGKQSTRIFSQASRIDSSPVPQRELKKRKKVHFEDERKPGAVATSDFVTQANRKWTFVATCFGLPEEARPVHREKDDELLGLCKYFDGDESVPNIDDDSEDSVPFAIFAEQGMCITWRPRTTFRSSTVSTLRLSSMLRLESRSQVTTPFKETQNNLQSSFPSDDDDLEKAFQGVLPCSNHQKGTRAHHLSKADENQDDFGGGSFWEIVEF